MFRGGDVAERQVESRIAPRSANPAHVLGGGLGPFGVTVNRRGQQPQHAGHGVERPATAGIRIQRAELMSPQVRVHHVRKAPAHLCEASGPARAFVHREREQAPAESDALPVGGLDLERGPTVLALQRSNGAIEEPFGGFAFRVSRVIGDVESHRRHREGEHGADGKGRAYSLDTRRS